MHKQRVLYKQSMHCYEKVIFQVTIFIYKVHDEKFFRSELLRAIPESALQPTPKVVYICGTCGKPDIGVFFQSKV